MIFTGQITRFSTLTGGFFSGLLLGLAHVAHADNSIAEINLKTFENLPIVASQPQPESDYRLALGVMKKANSRWYAEREQRLAGILRRYTQALGEEWLPEDAFNYYQQQMRQRDGRLLFSCQGRNCGSSGSWANEHFKIRQLYGLDQFQWYSAYELAGPDDGHIFLAIYAVTRGNRRSFVQIDVMSTNALTEPVATSPKTIIDYWQSGESFVVPAVTFDQGKLFLAATHKDSIIKALQLVPRTKITIVASGSNSKAAADGLRAVLLDQGIQPVRVGVSDVNAGAGENQGLSLRLDVMR